MAVVVVVAVGPCCHWWLIVGLWAVAELGRLQLLRWIDCCPSCCREGTGDPEQRDPGPGYPLADDTTPPPGQAGPASNASFGAWCGANAPPPVQALGPHVAPIGLEFYPTSPAALPGGGGGAAPTSFFPPQYQGGVFIAQHGSWNRTIRIGYRVMHLTLTPEGAAANYTLFATGWLRNDSSVWGRPVGVLVLPDGSLLVSDDSANVVYRISYAPPAPPAG